jgi:hypothetical protein
MVAVGFGRGAEVEVSAGAGGGTGVSVGGGIVVGGVSGAPVAEGITGAAVVGWIGSAAIGWLAGVLSAMEFEMVGVERAARVGSLVTGGEMRVREKTKEQRKRASRAMPPRVNQRERCRERGRGEVLLIWED